MDGEVVIQTFNAGPEAEIAAGFLRERGFSARTETHFSLDITPFLNAGPGGARLFVPASEASEARAALEELSAAAVESDELAPSEPPSEEEAQEQAISAEDAKARRARNAAIVGVMVFPPLLSVWSLAACIEIDATRLSPRGRLHRRVAIAVDATVICLAAWVAIVTW